MSQITPAATQSTVLPASSITASEQYCQELTRREARNFYWGFVALPKRQRVAIYALYSFSRQVDDDVDLADADQARQACERQRARIEACYTAGGEETLDDPVVRVLSEVVKEYNIPRDELLALVRGVEMDLETQRYKTWDELKTYTHHVASAVGRMTTRIFGFDDPIALSYADDLGTALQITNILRDVREDYELGRIYLPSEDLNRFDIEERQLGSSPAGTRWPDLVKFEVARAREYYASGLKITDHIPRRAAACVLTMGGMYGNILGQIEADPDLPLRGRAQLRKRTKLKVILGSWLRAM